MQNIKEQTLLAIALFISLAISVFLYNYIENIQQETLLLEFNSESERNFQELSSSILHQMESVKMMDAFVENSSNVSEEEFMGYSKFLKNIFKIDEVCLKSITEDKNYVNSASDQISKCKDKDLLDLTTLVSEKKTSVIVSDYAKTNNGETMVSTIVFDIGNFYNLTESKVLSNFIAYNNLSDLNFHFLKYMDNAFTETSNQVLENKHYFFKKLGEFDGDELYYFSVSNKMTDKTKLNQLAFFVSLLIFILLSVSSIFIYLINRNRNQLELASYGLLKTNKLLKESKEDMNQFLHIASHDLKSPMRALTTLSTWIIEDKDNTLSDDSKENVGLIQARSKRMTVMLDSLLEYSKQGKSTEKPSDVNVEEFVREIFNDLHKAEQFKIIYNGPEIKFKTKVIMLRHIFSNLMDNAIKHAGETNTREITVTASALEDTYEFSVSDKGAGFDIKHKDRIFGLFKTLKSKDEVDGAGMGLTLIKKSIEAYGGKIWISQAGVNQGATFCFTWPKEIKS